MNPKSPFALIIIDGFGYSDPTESDESIKYNAIAQAETPVWDRLWNEEQHCLLNCSGKAVGLPDNQMGNSEVGHMNISAGRVIYQDLTKIDLDIASGMFFENPVLIDLVTDSVDNNRALHICGLVSDGGVHSHLHHFIALIELAAKYKLKKLYIHAFLDGRDTPPKSALNYLLELQQALNNFNTGQIVTLVGRYYAMDRDKRWDRVSLAYNLLTQSQENPENSQFYYFSDLSTAINKAYERGETDEFIKPTILTSDKNSDINSSIKLNHSDNLIFMNFRADRARQLSQMLSKYSLNKFVTLTQYEANLIPDKYIAYPPMSYNNMLGEFLSKNHCTQLRIAETEKYAHVTFFFNGGNEQPFLNEDRILIPSPKVSTYDLKPEMSAFELTEQLCHAIESNKYDAIICNYANPDMVGHTGDLDATIKAIEVIDRCLGKIVSSIRKIKGQMLITADHGNAECMYDSHTQQAHTAHTNSLAPLLYYSADPNKQVEHVAGNQEESSLIDIAPTMLHLMGLQPPSEMTGKILFKLNEQNNTYSY
ncbi:MAG: 2,3-bisphosphoglycerate-independent phosphoglycerate mutase [Gammaproteobacteria bacterium]|nr:2,3-bisphosphoglycerate-independent phosphoglycerate mutase [Gammaproteobacteria bacterium]